MSDELEGVVFPDHPPRCSQCGTELPPGASVCPSCEVRVIDVPSRSTAAKPASGPAHHIVSLMLTIPLIAVFFALCRNEPVFASLYAALALPVFLLTLVRALRRRAEGKPMGADEKIYFFMKISFQIVAVIVAVVVSLVIALFVICSQL